MRQTNDFGRQLQNAPGSTHKDSQSARRTLPQNRKMWAMLTDISRQVRWMVDGKNQLISREDWKDLFSAWLLRHQRVANGIDGGVVLLGQKTSKMDTTQMATMILGIYAFGDQREVIWSEPKMASLLEWAEQQMSAAA